MRSGGFGVVAEGPGEREGGRFGSYHTWKEHGRPRRGTDRYSLRMRSRFLLVALGALLALAVVLWMRASPGAAVPEPASRSAESTVPDIAPQLVQPAQDEPRVDRGVVEPAAPPAPAAAASPSTWTGVRIRVVAEEDGKPVANVRVRARNDDEKQSWKEVKRSHGVVNEEPITGADGVAELELPSGTPYEIHVRYDGEHTVVAKRTVDPALAAGEVREISISLRLQPDVVMHGRVIDRETNAPIADARVGLSRDWKRLIAGEEQRTDRDGRFVLAARSERNAIFGVRAAGYEPALVPPMNGHETPETALEIALSPVATVRVTVRDSGGTPMPGLRVTFETAMYRFGRPDGMSLLRAGRSGNATFAATTDAGGVAFLADLPPRMPLEGALLRGREQLLRAPEVLTLTPGESRAIEWRLGSGCTIHGIAREVDDRPAADLEILLETAWAPRPIQFEPFSSRPRRATKTDAEGHFAFADVGPGNWWIGPAPAKRTVPKIVEADAAAPTSHVVTVAPGLARLDVEIRVHRGLTIEGLAVDPAGTPTSGAMIMLTRPTDKLFAYEHVDEGRFVLGPLEPGEYELRAQSHGEFVSSEPVTARAGDRDVVLRMRAGGVLRGTVVDKATGKAGPASVVVRPHTPDDWAFSHPSANEKGVFELPGLAPGLYDIAASTSNGQAGIVRDVEVAAGETRDVRIEVEPGARVRVRYEGPWPSCNLTVLVGEVIVSADGIEKGTERLFDAPAGAVVVRMFNHAEDKGFDLPLTLAVGETRDLVFDGTWK